MLIPTARRARSSPLASTRILGRRTAPFPPFLIPNHVPHGFTQDPSTDRAWSQVAVSPRFDNAERVRAILSDSASGAVESLQSGGPSRIFCVLTQSLRAKPRSHCRAPLRLPLPPLALQRHHR